MKIIYTILVLFALVVVGGSAYIYTNLDSFMNNRGAQEGTDVQLVGIPAGKQNEEKIVAPFYLRDATQPYKDLNVMVNGHVTVNADMNSVAQKQIRVPVYEAILKFYRDETHPAKERAYALNLANLIFILGFDAETLKEGLAKDPELSKEFQKHLDVTKKLKTKKDGAPGTMFSTGSAAMNYAAQKTMATMNRMALELYPTSYALLRSNINEVQAEWVLYTNFETGKNYETGAHILRDKLGASYFDDFQAQIYEHERKGTLYEDTYAASPEINIMYAQAFLWYRYALIANDTTKAKEARAILDEALEYHDRMVTDTDEYNTGRLFYGYVLSALGKSRIAQTGVYSAEESEKLMVDAENTLIKVLKTSRNKQLPYWLKNLPARGWIKLELDRLAQRNKDIDAYVKSL